MASAKRRPFCLGLKVSNAIIVWYGTQSGPLQTPVPPKIHLKTFFKYHDNVKHTETTNYIAQLFATPILQVPRSFINMEMICFPKYHFLAVVAAATMNIQE